VTITIVCGPPCAGKSTYVEQHAQPGDTVIDYDLIARELGSTREHLHHPRHRQPAWALYTQRIRHAAGATNNVWIIRAIPARHLTRDTALDAVLDHAQTVELHPPTAVLLARARARHHPDWHERALRAWLKQWGHADGGTNPVPRTTW
jgi:predicted kinase